MRGRRKLVPAPVTEATNPAESGGLVWETRPGDAVMAPISYAGPYVISHRPEEHTVSFRIPGQHAYLGVFTTEEEAKQAAEAHHAARRTA